MARCLHDGVFFTIKGKRVFNLETTIKLLHAILSALLQKSNHILLFEHFFEIQRVATLD